MIILLSLIICLILTGFNTKSMLYHKIEDRKMLLLAKLAGILVLIWFYLTGQKMGEPPVKWAIIGLIGYWLGWWLGDIIILAAVAGMFSKSTAVIFVITQLPVICGVIVAFFVRKKLIKDVAS